MHSKAPVDRAAGQRHKKFAAGLLRLAFALGGIAAAQRYDMQEFRWIFGVYGAFGVAMLVMISRDWGGDVRALTAGAADLLLITFVVHLTGSVHTSFVALYVIATMIYGVAQSPRTGAFLSTLACFLYVAVVALERAEVLAYGPRMNTDVVLSGPISPDGLVAAVLVLAMLAASSVSNSLVALSTRTRESELETLTQQLAELSRKDPLTNLFNRRHIEREVERSLAWSRRGRESVVIAIDLDGFKAVNDTSGHSAGDALLVAIANTIRECVRDVDVVGRQGGDEFLVILNDTDIMQSTVVGKRIIDEIRDVAIDAAPTARVTASLGLAIVKDNDTVQTVLERADVFAYQAKSRGGDQLRGSG